MPSFTGIMRTLEGKFMLVVGVGLTKSPSSSGTRDKDMTLASSQTRPLQNISAPVTAVAST